MRRLFLLLGLSFVGCASPAEEPSRPFDHLDEWRAITRLELVRDGDATHYAPFLHHESAHLRAAAARALGRVWTPAVVPALVEVASRDDESSQVLEEALFALGQLRDRSAAAVLIARTTDDSIRVRAAAIEALGKLTVDPAAADGGLRIATLGRALRDVDPSVRCAAALALFRVGTAPEGAAGVVPSLIDRLRIEMDGEVRWRIVYALSRIDDAATTRALVDVAMEPHPWVRAFAAAGLSRPGIPEAVAPLIEILGDPDSHWTARANAAQSLRRLRADGIGDRSRILDALLGRLHVERHPLVLQGVIESLGDAPASDAEAKIASDILEALLEKPGATPTERCAALRALGGVPGPRSVATLSNHLAPDRSLWERVAAIEALGRIGAASEGDAGLLERWIPLLDDESALVRATVVESIGQLPTEERWDYVRAALDDADFAVRTTAVAALARDKPTGWAEKLRATYERSGAFEYWETRNTIIESLLDDGAASAAELDGRRDFLRRALEDPVQGVRLRAAEKLGVTAPLPPTAQFLDRPYSRLEPWEMIGRSNPRVTFETSKGSFVVELFLSDAPEHVSNLVQLAREGFYDGLPFHRVVPSFVVQGGDPRGDGWGDDGYHLPHEIHPGSFLRGSVGMPTSGPDTGGCQIFIDHLPTPHLDGRYTVFGRVVLGMETVDRLEVGDRVVRVVVDELRHWSSVP